MDHIKWNHRLCVVCGRCLVACVEKNNCCYSRFDVNLADNEQLYSWNCTKYGRGSDYMSNNIDKSITCGWACVGECPEGALIKK